MHHGRAVVHKSSDATLQPCFSCPILSDFDRKGVLAPAGFDICNFAWPLLPLQMKAASDEGSWILYC
jgi:hypothetical protein